MRKSIKPRFDKFIQTKPMLLLGSMFNWPRKKIRQAYAWVVGWSDKPSAEKALAGISFAESSFFPIPPDPLLITLTIAKPSKYLKFALIATVSSILGGIFGYLIGVGLFESVGQWVINTYHLESEFAYIEGRYAASAFIAIFTAAFTPIPYKLITISAGVFGVNFIAFLLASILGRGLRFFLVATLMHHFGAKYKDQIEKYIDILSIIFVILLVGGIYILKQLA